MAKNSTVYIAVSTGGPSAKVIAERYGLGVSSSTGRTFSSDVACIEGLRRLLEDVSSGLEPGRVYVASDRGDGTAATGTLVCVQASVADGDYVKFGDVKFTARTTPSSDVSKGEFAFLTSDTITGAALAAAVNAHPAMKSVGTAANSSGTVTLTLNDKGLFGNCMKITKSGTGFTATSPTNGAVGTMQIGLTARKKF